MPIIRGYFFDLDGTLVHTHKADYLAYRDAIREVTGKTIIESDFAKTNGQDVRIKLQAFGLKLPEDAILEIVSAKKRHYPNYMKHTFPNSTLVDLLAAAPADVVRVLVTIAKTQNARTVLEAHNLTHHFDHMLFGEDISHPKPHPEIYLKALAISGLHPSEVLAFEDSDSGVAAAEAAGLAVMRVTI
jgi:HAD superfamily hydrolase (TIGR01509 family)